MLSGSRCETGSCWDMVENIVVIDGYDYSEFTTRSCDMGPQLGYGEIHRHFVHWNFKFRSHLFRYHPSPFRISHNNVKQTLAGQTKNDLTTNQLFDMFYVHRLFRHLCGCSPYLWVFEWYSSGKLWAIK